MLRAGEIPGCNTYAQYVHVGHSYGSVLTNSFVSSSPDLSDGLILTGYSNNHTYEDLFISTVGRLARQNQPARFGALSTGYITWGDVYENQRSFYAYPYFDTAVVIAAESSKWPVTAGELVSTSALEFAAPGFRGPVLVSWFILPSPSLRPLPLLLCSTTHRPADSNSNCQHVPPFLLHLFPP